MDHPYYHLIVFTPLSHAGAVRAALAGAGAGRVGKYDGCSFSSRGIGRYRPLQGAHPTIGSVGRIEEVEEECIQVVVPGDRASLRRILQKLRDVHPYEEPAIHLIPMADYKQYLE